MADHTDPTLLFDLLKPIGEGWQPTHGLIHRSYGHVYLGRHKETGQLLAIKIMKTVSDMRSIKKEIHMLKDCDCNHVVRYFGSYTKDDHVWVGLSVPLPDRLSSSIVAAAHCAT